MTAQKPTVVLDVLLEIHFPVTIHPSSVTNYNAEISSIVMFIIVIKVSCVSKFDIDKSPYHY